MAKKQAYLSIAGWDLTDFSELNVGWLK